MSDLPTVAGRRVERTLADLERAALVRLSEEQRSPGCDNALVAILCDTVRLTREHADSMRVLPMSARTVEERLMDFAVATPGLSAGAVPELAALVTSLLAEAVAGERERCAALAREDCHDCGRCGDEGCDCAMNDPKEPIRASPCCGRCGPLVWDILEPDHDQP